MDDYFEYINGLNLIFDDSLDDLDGDGLNNLLEFQINSMVNNNDTDGDLMLDLYEYENGLNLTLNDADFDLDNDGLNNLLEFQLGSSANNDDTDGDGMPDEYEYLNNLDLNSNDTMFDQDLDGLTNIQEYQLGTDPNNPDSDNDGYRDKEEYDNGSNPLDPESIPRNVFENFGDALTGTTGGLVTLGIGALGSLSLGFNRFRSRRVGADIDSLLGAFDGDKKI